MNEFVIFPNACYNETKVQLTITSQIKNNNKTLFVCWNKVYLKKEKKRTYEYEYEHI